MYHELMGRPEYPLRITINGRQLNKVVIDQHYRMKHSESITDEIILALVQELDGRTFPIERTSEEFEYFTEGEKYDKVSK